MVKTLILCGGRGSRLRPLTDTVPKTLVPLNGKPLLQHLIESYIDKGFSEFVLCVGYRGDMVRAFFREQPFTAQIEFSDAGESASMLQRIYAARELIEDRVVVAYGDTLIDLNLDDLLEAHESSGAKATITTADVRSPFGLVMSDEEGWACSFEEKPLQSYYIGHMVLEREVLEHLDQELLTLPDGDGLVRLFDKLIQQKCLRTHSYNGPQITFNTQQELKQAEDDFVAFFTHQEENHCP